MSKQKDLENVIESQGNAALSDLSKSAGPVPTDTEILSWLLAKNLSEHPMCIVANEGDTWVWDKADIVKAMSESKAQNAEVSRK